MVIEDGEESVMELFIMMAVLVSVIFWMVMSRSLEGVEYMVSLYLMMA